MRCVLLLGERTKQETRSFSPAHVQTNQGAEPLPGQLSSGHTLGRHPWPSPSAAVTSRLTGSNVIITLDPNVSLQVYSPFSGTSLNYLHNRHYRFGLFGQNAVSFRGGESTLVLNLPMLTIGHHWTIDGSLLEAKNCFFTTSFSVTLFPSSSAL